VETTGSSTAERREQNGIFFVINETKNPKPQSLIVGGGGLFFIHTLDRPAEVNKSLFIEVRTVQPLEVSGP
jgi:hypothetical protein